MSAGKVKCQFFSVFFPTEVIYRLYQWSLRKKTEKCQFLCSMYVCKAKTDICQFFSVFFHPPSPKTPIEFLYLETGTLPVMYVCMYVMMSRRLNFLKHIHMQAEHELL